MKHHMVTAEAAPDSTLLRRVTRAADRSYSYTASLNARSPGHAR
jgi:hypothetical protein